MKTIENGYIDSTSIGIEDHGILTLWLYLRFASSEQGYGGYALDRWDSALGRRVGSALLAETILALLDIFGVGQWHQLKGLPCRVKRDRPFGMIQAIGHFTDDKWVSFKQIATEFQEDTADAE